MVCIASGRNDCLRAKTQADFSQEFKADFLKKGKTTKNKNFIWITKYDHHLKICYPLPSYFADCAGRALAILLKL